MSDGQGNSPMPVELLERNFLPLEETPVDVRQPRRRPFWPALILFCFTVVSTLSVGSEFAISYMQGREPFSGDQDLLGMMLLGLKNPSLLLSGMSFSFTLMAILLAHELGHYFAARAYGIDVSYPYFIPAPNFFGTFGAFIRIRSPITTRRALFDVGLAGPVVGFLVALPAMAYGIAASKVVPGVEDNSPFVFGHPPLLRLFEWMFHPNVNVSWILLSPVARAAWVGLFVTALNLLPAWQLDGGHIMFGLASRWHRRLSIFVAVALIVMGWFTMRGIPFPDSLESPWYLWGGLLLVLTLRFRHPPVYDSWQPLDPARRGWAVMALIIFLVSFTPWPLILPS